MVVFPLSCTKLEDSLELDVNELKYAIIEYAKLCLIGKSSTHLNFEIKLP